MNKFKLRELTYFTLGALVFGLPLYFTSVKAELNGRLGACKDITTVLNSALPLELQCEVLKGDVYVSSPLKPGAKVSLDGSKVIQAPNPLTTE
jgi:hypothetical protein